MKTSPQVLAVTTLALVALVGAGCTDGTPEFCDSLRRSADLSALGDALDAGELDNAAAEARRLADLADEAPPELRSDLTALADAVVDIVDLVGDEAAGTADASEIERRRDQLNQDLAELDQRSERVANWALTECGLRLD